MRFSLAHFALVAAILSMTAVLVVSHVLPFLASTLPNFGK
jgi:hypothetical protein